MNLDLNADLRELDATSTTIEKVVDVDELSDRVREPKTQAADPSLWDDPDHAQQVASTLLQAQAKMKKIDPLRGHLDDLSAMYELVEEESDSDVVEAADVERAELRTAIESLEVTTTFPGPCDGCGAVVNIRSGAGGVDAADWAEMLTRMYLRWANKCGYKVEVYDTSYTEEVGIKSATFAVHGEYMYGTLSVEQGAYRLVCISPSDNQGCRQTSSAEVEVLSAVEEMDHIDIPESDLRIDIYCPPGPGGQPVNTTDLAVRLMHVLTGIVVTCQNEKSQHQNKASAMRVLQAKLLEKKRQEERAESDAFGTDGNASWGSQMRSYVLYPYQAVEDLCIEYEVNNSQSVLDGDLDDFIEAGICWRMAQQFEGGQCQKGGSSPGASGVSGVSGLLGSSASAFLSFLLIPSSSCAWSVSSCSLRRLSNLCSLYSLSVCAFFVLCRSKEQRLWPENGPGSVLVSVAFSEL